MGDGNSIRTLKEFSIPDYILLPGTEIRGVSHVPSCPVIVFINTKSGGQLGGELLVTYSTLLNKNQVRFCSCYASESVMFFFLVFYA